eukprot:977779-Pyramimonas_sp.AAC.1
MNRAGGPANITIILQPCTLDWGERVKPTTLTNSCRKAKRHWHPLRPTSGNTATRGRVPPFCVSEIPFSLLPAKL